MKIIKLSRSESVSRPNMVLAWPTHGPWSLYRHVPWIMVIMPYTFKRGIRSERNTKLKHGLLMVFQSPNSRPQNIDVLGAFKFIIKTKFRNIHVSKISGPIKI